MNPWRGYVYTLSGPDGRVRYVGSASSPALRLRDHLACVRHPPYRQDSQLDRWLKVLAWEGELPTMEVVSRHRTRGAAYAAERAASSKLLRQGVPLVNLVVRGNRGSRRLRRDARAVDTSPVSVPPDALLAYRKELARRNPALGYTLKLVKARKP